MIIAFLAVWITLAAVAGVVAQKKRRYVAGWVIITLLMGITILVLLALPPLPELSPMIDTRECPRCREVIKRQATICRHCSLELPAVPILVNSAFQAPGDRRRASYNKFMTATCVLGAAALLIYEIAPERSNYSASSATGVAYAAHVEPDMSSSRNRLFRTRITAASREAPNFAWHYVIAEWGCGTDCVTGIAFDKTTGKVLWLPGAYVGPHFTGDPEKLYRYALDNPTLVVTGHDGEADQTAYTTRCYTVQDDLPSFVKIDCPP